MLFEQPVYRMLGDSYLSIEFADTVHLRENFRIQAIAKALGDKTGIRRYGSCLLPMDDALVRTALDLSGRPFLIWNLDLPTPKIGTFDTELVREFFQAMSTHAGITLHVDLLHGVNSHHIAEAAFKSVARALREAVETDPRKADAVPSTKGTL